MIDWGKHRANPPPPGDGDDGYGPLAPRRRHDSVTNFRPSPFDGSEPSVTVLRPTDEDDLAHRPTAAPGQALTTGARRFVVRNRDEGLPSNPLGRVAIAPAEYDARPSAATVPGLPPSYRTRGDMRAQALFPGAPEPGPIHQLPIFLGARGRLLSFSGGEGASRLRPSRTAIVALVAFAAVFIAVVLALRIGVLRSLQRAEAAMPRLEPLPVLETVPPPPPALEPSPSASTASSATAKAHRRHHVRRAEADDEEEEEDVAPVKKGSTVDDDDQDATAHIQDLARDQLENSLH